MTPRQINACNPAAPRQSSIRRDRQNTFLIVRRLPSRLSRYSRWPIAEKLAILRAALLGAKTAEPKPTRTAR
jgi:hypothetical protein